MSFGFSVGDVLAVGRLVTDIVSCLKNANGTRTEYQDLVRELECLQLALVHLDKLSQGGMSRNLASIKYAALSCRRPLEDFLARIRSKYDRSLDVASKPSSIRGVIDKIKFPLGHGDEIRKLQAYLNVHIGTINMLLAEYGLERIALEADKGQADRLEIKQRLKDTTGILNRIGSNISGQIVAVSKSMSMLEKLYEMIGGEVRAKLQHLANMATKVCVSTQQIYAVLLEIQVSVAKGPDVRWTFLQNPVIVEDALGRKFPVPSEYDFSLLDAIIRRKFQAGPCSAHVAAGEYEIMDTKNRSHVLTVGSFLTPGGSLTMAILVAMAPPTVSSRENCPTPDCKSTNTSEAPGGGRLCTRKLRKARDVWEIKDTPPTGSQPGNRTSHEARSDKKRKRLPNDVGLGASRFKNLKIAGFEGMFNKFNKVVYDEWMPSTYSEVYELDADADEYSNDFFVDQDIQCDEDIQFDGDMLYDEERMLQRSKVDGYDDGYDDQLWGEGERYDQMLEEQGRYDDDMHNGVVYIDDRSTEEMQYEQIWEQERYDQMLEDEDRYNDGYDEQTWEEERCNQMLEEEERYDDEAY